ncbi:hypothetical protein RUND412_001515 [Rhizina undulata]
MAVDLIADQGPRIVAIAGGFMAAISFTIIVRLYVRIRIVRCVGMDDWTMLLGTVSGPMALSAVAIVEVGYGAGKHRQDIPPADFTHGMMLNYISQVLYVVATALVKMSICLFLLRLAATPTFRKICKGLLIFIGAYSALSAIGVSMTCIPVARIWDKTVEGECMSSDALTIMAYGYSAVGMLTDFSLVFLPVPMLWRLRIPRRQKALLCLILGFGAFASTATIVKITYNVNYGKTGDFLWDCTNLTIWSILELDIGIITASMPAVKPLFKRILERTGYSSGSGRRSSNIHPLQSLQTPKITTNICANSQNNSERNLNDSEESIFPQASNMGSITKSTEVRMDLEQLGDEHCLDTRDVIGQCPV